MTNKKVNYNYKLQLKIMNFYMKKGYWLPSGHLTLIFLIKFYS